MSSNHPDPMLKSRAELLFPTHLIPRLRDLRGEEWRELVDRVSALPETHPDSLAFVLMIVDLNECLKCHSRSYKYLRGCALCSTQLLHSFKGSDAELMQRYRKAQQQVWQRLQINADVNADELSIAA